MQLLPSNWDVVLVGYWNKAILTPKGIADRLFQIEDGKQVRVDVPLDGLAPCRVHDDNNGLMVMAGNNRLVITPNMPTYDSLVAALKVGKRALQCLPETPVQAVGFNLRFQTKDSVGLNNAMWLFNKDIDDRFSDASFEITARSIERSLKFIDGTLNCRLSLKDEQIALDFNFDRTTTEHEELVNWLKVPEAEIQKMVQQTVDALGLEIKEDSDDGYDEEE